MKPDLKMSEAEFKDMVISIAKRYGWLVHHDLPAQNTRGRWMTNVQGDVGFPDLFMVHPFQAGRPLVIELKAEKGKTTPGQKIWLNACELAGCHAAVWKPSDMEYILHSQQYTLKQSKSNGKQSVSCMCVPRSHEVGSKQGNLGRSVRPESCKTK
jgi:hypothetical protein